MQFYQIHPPVGFYGPGRDQVLRIRFGRCALDSRTMQGATVAVNRWG